MTGDQHVTVTLGSQISGRLLQADGTPVTTGAVVTDDGQRVGAVDGDGTFAGTVAAGSYNLKYTQRANGSFPRDGIPDIHTLGSVDATNSTDIGETTLATPQVVMMMVTNERGEPIADAPVEISQFWWDTETQTRSDTGLTTNATDQLVQPNGAEGFKLPPEAAVSVAPPQGTAYMGYWSAWLELSTDRHLNVILADSTAVSGTVQDGNGTAATGGSIIFRLPEQHHSWSTDVNTDGYQLDLTRDATHDVLYYQWEADKAAEFARDGRPDVYSLPAAMPTGATETLDFSLPIAHVLNVTVTNDDGMPVENAHPF